LKERVSILVVDDDEDTRNTLKKIFTNEGYDTDTAKTGAEAIEKLRSKPFNVAIIDIFLPDMRGTRLLPQIKAISPRIRRIMITGNATLDNAIEALNLGVDAYITKPIDPIQLLRVIEEKLRDQREEQRALDLLYEALKVLEKERENR